MRELTTVLTDFVPELVVGTAQPVGPSLAFQPPVAAAPGSYGALPMVPEMRACVACTARQEARQVVVGVGPASAVGMVLGQNPGHEEDLAGVPFIGGAGDLLNEWLVRLGLDRHRLVLTNAVKCHTYQNRVPRALELKTCYAQTVSKELEALTALRVIFPVGKPAVGQILGKSAPPMTPLSAHHYLVRATGAGPARDLHVFPLPHPAFLLRARHLTALMQTVLAHVRRTLEQELPDAYALMRK